jgi:hypothetical protein
MYDQDQSNNLFWSNFFLFITYSHSKLDLGSDTLEILVQLLAIGKCMGPVFVFFCMAKKIETKALEHKQFLIQHRIKPRRS